MSEAASCDGASATSARGSTTCGSAGSRPRPTTSSATIPGFKWRGLRATSLPDDLTGASVLDIGCNAGFYSLEMKRRGAGRVVGIDTDPHYLRQARFAAEQAGADIELRQMSVYDVGRARRAVRPRDLHGRALPPAPPAAGAGPDPRARGRRPACCSSACSAATTAPPSWRRTTASTNGTSSTARTSPGCTSSSIATPTIRPTGSSPTPPRPRRCCAAPGFAIEAHPEREVYLCRRTDRSPWADPPPAIA